MKRAGFSICLLILCVCLPTFAANALDSLKVGNAELKSAESLAFGPEGILLVGDSTDGSIWAIDTGDRASSSSAAAINLSGVDAKLAGLLGIPRDQVLINDMAVNPISHKAYLSVSRGRGPDAQAVLASIDASGTISVLDLQKVRHSKVAIPNAPDPNVKDRRGRSRRGEAITDLAYLDGQVIVAGLSNEEFASKLRAVNFPFSAADTGTSVEIFHGAHGRFETNSPVRTFVPFEIKSEPHILAAYTCTPLVTFPASELKPGSKVMGTTIAELGNRNRPLDMVVYRKNGKQHVLMANSSRGVMKLVADNLDTFKGITERTDVSGVPYETIEGWTGVQQLDKLDEMHALLLIQGEDGASNLKTVAFP